MRISSTNLRLCALSALTTIALAACGGGSDGVATPLSIRFKAVDAGLPVDCNTPLTGLGPAGDTIVGISDLRFYISNIHLYDADGNEAPAQLAENEFQLSDPAGDVALIDLTSNSTGSCTSSAIAFSEGTERVHDVLQLLTDGRAVSRVSFDVGVPQRLMKKVLSTHTAEDAPSPLRELQWSWASGYRHFLFNFTVKESAGGTGEGYMHLGSRDCGGNGAVGLTDRDTCGFLNTPAVDLHGFDPSTQSVTVDLRRALEGLTFVTALYDSNPPYELVGSGPGVACHSAPVEAQPDCAAIFANFGLDAEDGHSSAAANDVFGFQ